MLIVQLLQWDLSAVTPLDYVDQLLSRLSDVITDAHQRAAVKRHAVTFITMCTAGDLLASNACCAVSHWLYLCV